MRDPIIAADESFDIRVRASGNPDFPSLPLLVRLRGPDIKNQPILGEAGVFHRETRQLRPAEAARVSDQQQSPVSYSDQACGQRVNDLPEVFGQKRVLALLRRSDGSSDTLEGLADRQVTCGGGRLIARGLMCLGDRGQPPGDLPAARQPARSVM
jgi:hypothetical protein